MCDKQHRRLIKGKEDEKKCQRGRDNPVSAKDWFSALGSSELFTPRSGLRSSAYHSSYSTRNKYCERGELRVPPLEESS